MKVYTKIVIDMRTGEIVREASYDYVGPVAWCGGGSGGGTSIDKAYNDRMATIAEQQQGWATKLMNLWEYGDVSPGGETMVTPYSSTAQTGQGYYMDTQDNVALTSERYKDISDNGSRNLEDPRYEGRFKWYAVEAPTKTNKSYMDLEQGMVEQNLRLLPLQGDLAVAQIEAEKELLPAQTDTTLAQLNEMQTKLAARAPLLQDLYQAAADGTNIDSAMNRAQSDVARAFDNQTQLNVDAIRRTGANVGGGRLADLMRRTGLERSKQIAGARTSARDTAKDKNFMRLADAIKL